jgi:NADH-quinone oxidoreductase subunit G
MLIGLNTRYEGVALNLKLRSRFLKGNFNVVTLGSLIDLTFSYTSLGNNFKILTSLAEGNNLFCQELCNSLNPILICSSEMFKRKDSSNLAAASQLLIKNISSYSLSKTENHLNVLNSTINQAGTASLNVLKTIRSKDIQSSVGIYFLNNSFNSTTIKKLLNLKLLGFLKKNVHENKVLITQSTILQDKTLSELKKNFKIQKHLNLPNTVFFETAETYMNTEGNIKKTVKIMSPTGQAKSNWQIIRKIFAYSKKILFVSSLMPNSKLIFNCNNVNHFKNYIGFHQYATSNLNNLSFNLVKNVSELNTISQPYKYKRKKALNTNFKYWLDNFYTGGKDGYSAYSSTMIQCSKFYQLNNTNFKNEIYKIM